MPTVGLKQLVGRAMAEGWGVAAINVVNDVSIEAVLAAAAQEHAPVVLQTSVKTVKQYGAPQLHAIVTAIADGFDVPYVLHLDHCPDRAVISDCLANGWGSVLFDDHDLDVAENLRQTIEVVAEARAVGADVEGEIEGIQGVEDGIGSDAATKQQTLDIAVDYIRRSGVDVFAPSIGNAHGRYKQAPVLDADRISALVAATGVPQALHGGTGLGDEVFRDLIARGCAKVNISTALKEAYLKSSWASLQEAAAKDRWDPPTLFRAQRQAVLDMAAAHMRLFGSAGRA
jgi:fructose-bisphosphate aldolase, class II